jgi:hypothetical protein
MSAIVLDNEQHVLAAVALFSRLETQLKQKTSNLSVVVSNPLTP